MSKKTRNKKYNPRKSFLLAMNAAVFESWESETEGTLSTCRTNVATQMMREAIISTKRDWILHVIVILDSGDEFTIREVSEIYRNKRLNDCTDDYKNLKQRHTDACNPNMVVDVGWLIRPYSNRLGRKLAWDQDKVIKKSVDNKILELEFAELEKTSCM